MRSMLLCGTSIYAYAMLLYVYSLFYVKQQRPMSPGRAGNGGVERNAGGESVPGEWRETRRGGAV